jgi:hypothetical protein
VLSIQDVKYEVWLDEVNAPIIESYDKNGGITGLLSSSYVHLAHSIHDDGLTRVQYSPVEFVSGKFKKFKFIGNK